MPNNTRENGNFYLYQTLDDTKYATSQLKNIFNFLRSYYKLTKPNFSHVHENISLMKKLSIRNNLLLDSLPSHLSKNKGSQLDLFLASNRNLHFQELFQKVDFWNCKPAEITKEQLSLYGVIRALIKKSNYIIIEKPQHIFDKNIQSLIQKSLIYETEVNKSNVIIHLGDDSKNWDKLCNKKISHKKNKPYCVTNNTMELQRPLNQDYTLIKKSA